MTHTRKLALLAFALVATQAAPLASAQTPDAWLTRCNREVAPDGKPEAAHYIFQTRGRTAGSGGRATFDYAATSSGTAVTYPTDLKGLMNPYSGPTLNISYFASADGTKPPSIGRVSLNMIAKDFKTIPGNPVTLKLLIDGATFGPYTPKESSGMYSLWFDTADTDGDSKPPMLKPTEFAKLAKAVDAMKTIDILLVQDGKDVVRTPIATGTMRAWRDALPEWTGNTAKNVTEANTFCGGGDRVVN